MKILLSIFTEIKLLACKLIKMLSEHSEVYDKDDDYEDEDEDMRDRQLLTQRVYVSQVLREDITINNR